MRAITLFLAAMSLFVQSSFANGPQIAGGFFQYNLDISSTNPFIKDYLSQKFSSDIELAANYAKQLTHLKFPKDSVTIIVKDSKVIEIAGKKYSQGQNGEYKNRGAGKTLAIVLEPDFNHYPAETIRGTFFHEFGHYLNEYHIKDLPFFKEFLSIYKSGSTSETGTKQESESMGLMMAYTEITGPYFELLADVFRVMALKEPGQYTSRDFSKIPSTFDDTEELEAHMILNPVRSFLWQAYLKDNISNEELKSKLWTKLVSITTDAIIAQYQVAKDAIIKNPKAEFTDLLPTAQQKNQNLIDLLKTLD